MKLNNPFETSSGKGWNPIENRLVKIFCLLIPDSDQCAMFVSLLQPTDAQNQTKPWQQQSQHQGRADLWVCWWLGEEPTPPLKFQHQRWRITPFSAFQFLTSSKYPLAAAVGPSLGAAAGKSRGRTVMPVASDALETLVNSILKFQHLCGPNYKT